MQNTIDHLHLLGDNGALNSALRIETSVVQDGGPLAAKEAVVAPASSAGPPILAVDAYARVLGLTTKPQLNGQRAKLLSYDEAKGRW